MSAATQPLNTLLDRCIDFLEGFEDDPEQCVAPLIQQLRRANCPGLLHLLVPDTGAPWVSAYGDFAWTPHAGTRISAFTWERHSNWSRPGLYEWSAKRFDESGRSWHTSGFSTVDDFGNLVEVPQ
ncbi:hypothetical protein VG_p42 [Variovorax phage VarioGold]|uniref:hypothetical protein n=1 Tax=Variovorax sp. ZS18.2.2 TaxID=2971255 RepID=UPI00215151BA|nr:hypothetical protein [Variovorax sp. ZS18.2.2]MCR6477546.1 hypothetical protein [Variovorax sp. ZS18.2.2]UYD72090.1 hypothetical protein VG_p42 [Variovorax phage VarioGold]